MPTISVLIDAKVAGLGEVGALDAEVNKLGASTTNLGGSLDKTTGQLNVSGAAHAAVAKEAQALGADVERAAGQVDLAGAAHAKASAATQNLSSQMGVAAGQAQAYGAQAETLSQKLGTLQGPSGLGGVEAAAAGTTTAIQDLAAVDAKAASATQATTDATAQSSAVIADLAAADATMSGHKKAATVTVVEEGAALEKAKVAHEAHTEAVMKGIKATGEFGEAGVAASEKLGALSGILGGAGGISPALVGVVVGLGAAVAVAKSTSESFLSAGEAVLKYQHVTGDTAQASSRMVDVFGQLGLGGDAAANTMFALNKRIEGLDGAATKTSKTLAEVGVEVEKNRDGSTNLDKTLGNVADAYNSATSAAQKDTIATTAFGKAGKDMIPVLEQGSAGLDKMANASQRVFDQQQLEQVHQYSIQQKQVSQDSSALADKIGGLVVPAIGDLQSKVLDVAGAWNYATASNRGQNLTLAESVVRFATLFDQGGKLAHQGRVNADAVDAEKVSIQQLNEELKAEEADKQALLDSDNKSLTASFALERATQAVANAHKTLADETLKDSEYANRHQAALDKVTVAQTNLSAAVRAHGSTSIQAKTAQDSLNTALDASKTLDQQNADAADRLSGAQLQLKEAMLTDAESAVKLAAEQAKLHGATLSAQEAAAAEAAQLDKLKAAAGGVLPVELQTLLDKLNSFHDVGATIHLRLDDQTGGMKGSFGTQIPAFDEGGKVPGPLGMPRLAVVHGGEEVLTPRQQQDARAAVSKGPSMDDTNELLAEQNTLLASIDRKLTTSPFGTRAYGA